MKDKVVIITGGTFGIGRALVYECASRGAKLVISGRNHEKLKEISEDPHEDLGHKSFR